MRRFWLLILAALLFPRPSTAQTPVIAGTVRDIVGNPIEGVTVSLERSRDSWLLRNITDETGHYVLVGVPTDKTYRLVARLFGYQEFIRPNTKGTEGHALIVDFAMFKQSVELDSTTVFGVGKPVDLEPIVVKMKRRLFAKQLATLTDAEIGDGGWIVTAADALTFLRPFAFIVREFSCEPHEWKVFVDSARMDFFYDETPVSELPIRYWNSVWVTTKRAYWLARKARDDS